MTKEELQEIEDNIMYYKDRRRELVEELLSYENMDFKSSQNNTDRVEVQHIKTVKKSLTEQISFCEKAINKLEHKKETFCQKAKRKSKLYSNFYGN